jgi:uncharacterized protein
MNSPATMYRKITVERDVPFKTSDGVRLYADLYYPDGPGRFPALLMRLPYNKDSAQNYNFVHPMWFARHGYLVVIQDTRGRNKSEGEFYPFIHEAQDGFETIQWVSDLPQCDGQVGMYGCSYPAQGQLLAASRQPPALAAAAPASAGIDFYRDLHYDYGGAFSLMFNASWATELARDTAIRQGLPELQAQLTQMEREYPQRCWNLPMGEVNAPIDFKSVAPYFYDWLEHPARDDYWRRIDVDEIYRQIQIPMLHMGGWYDAFVEASVRHYTRLKALGRDQNGRPKQRLVIGPWYHMPWTEVVGTVDFGDQAANPLNELLISWFNYWMKGADDAFLDSPPVKLFVMGENRWREAEDWPPPGTRFVKYYLHSAGRANTLSGNGWLSPETPQDELPDIYLYNPLDPVPSTGGQSCCFHPAAAMGAYDQRAVEMRNDVLVYSTPPLETDTEITGPVSAVLWAASSAPDTDFTVKLVDVHPCGKAINLCDGILRARFRDSLEEPSLIKADEIYRYEIQVGVTSNLFMKGHKIRVEVSSSNFPTYDRNPNNGQWPSEATTSDMKFATQTIFHAADTPSYISLPVAPR